MDYDVLRPYRLPGLVAWYDGGDSATISTSGGKVTQWSDKSGGGRHATQGTGSIRPDYTAGDYGLSFDGTQWLATTATDILNNVTAYSVYTAVVIDSTGADFGRTLAVDNGTQRAFRQFVIPGPPRRLRSFSTLADASDAYSENGTSGDAQDVRIIKTAIFDGLGNIFGYTNGVLDETQDTGTSGQATYNTGQALGIGARITGDNDFKGRIMEVIICHAAHDAGTRRRVEQYLKRRWNISG